MAGLNHPFNFLGSCASLGSPVIGSGHSGLNPYLYVSVQHAYIPSLASFMRRIDIRQSIIHKIPTVIKWGPLGKALEELFPSFHPVSDELCQPTSEQNMCIILMYLDFITDGIHNQLQGTKYNYYSQPFQARPLKD